MGSVPDRGCMGLEKSRAMNHFHIAKATDKSKLACIESCAGAGNQTGSLNCCGDGQRCTIMMMACFSNLLEWVLSQHTHKLSVSVKGSFHAVSDLLRSVLNGLVHPIRQTMTRSYTQTRTLDVQGLYSLQKYFLPQTFTHTSMLSVRRVPISIVPDNGLVNEVKHA